MKTNKINNFDKLLIVSILLVIILNPLTGQLALRSIVYMLDLAMTYGGSVISAPTSYIIGYMVFKLARKNKINIPSKTSKTHKAGSFLTK